MPVWTESVDEAIVPICGFPPATPFTYQVTAVFVSDVDRAVREVHGGVHLQLGVQRHSGQGGEIESSDDHIA